MLLITQNHLEWRVAVGVGRHSFSVQGSANLSSLGKSLLQRRLDSLHEDVMLRVALEALGSSHLPPTKRRSCRTVLRADVPSTSMAVCCRSFLERL